LKLFVERLNNDREAARAEAVIFAWLHQVGKNPKINEKADTGGVDFRCHPEMGGEFLVEVTSFKIDALSSASGLSMNLDPNIGGFFTNVTPELRQRIARKMDQLSGAGQLPRILAIASEHPKVGLVFDRSAVVNLLVSDWKFWTPLSDPSASVRVTDLKNSVFFRRDEANPSLLRPCRRSVSAVLLACIYSHRVEARGVIHPEPAVRLDISVLPEVPLLYLTEWPPRDGILKPAWTLPSDPPFPDHRRVRI